MDMKTGIYIIKNNINEKIYIGSAVNIEKRIKHHIWELQKGRHCNNYLQRAWNKYQEDNFSFETYLLCEKQNLIFYEQLTIDASIIRYGRENIYNISSTAGSTLGRKHTEASKIKIGLTSKGRNLGRKHTPKELLNMSLAQKGRLITLEHRQKISKSRIGIKLLPFTKEHKKRLSESEKKAWVIRKKNL